MQAAKKPHFSHVNGSTEPELLASTLGLHFCDINGGFHLIFMLSNQQLKATLLIFISHLMLTAVTPSFFMTHKSIFHFYKGTCRGLNAIHYKMIKH